MDAHKQQQQSDNNNSQYGKKEGERAGQENLSTLMDTFAQLIRAFPHSRAAARALAIEGTCQGFIKAAQSDWTDNGLPQNSSTPPTPIQHAGPELCEIPVNILCNETMTQTLGNPFLLVRPLENFCIAETDGCAAATGLQQPAECLSLPLSHLSPLHSTPFLPPSVVCHVVCCAVPISSLTGLCRRLLRMCVKQNIQWASQSFAN